MKHFVNLEALGFGCMRTGCETSHVLVSKGTPAPCDSASQKLSRQDIAMQTKMFFRRTLHTGIYGLCALKNCKIFLTPTRKRNSLIRSYCGRRSR